jgi:hypothetical protein
MPSDYKGKQLISSRNAGKVLGMVVESQTYTEQSESLGFWAFSIVRKRKY